MKRPGKGILHYYISSKGEFKLPKPEVLESIGAISLTWNWIEEVFDVTTSLALGLHPKLWVPIASRINGFEGKTEIIKDVARLAMNKDDCLVIANTCGSVMEHKRYRDAVIHACILDPTVTTAPTFKRHGKHYEVLVSDDALYALSARLALLSGEAAIAMSAFMFFGVAKGTLNAGRASLPDDQEGEMRQAELEFQSCMAQLRDHQKTRKDLPPLPKFLEEPLDPEVTEDDQSPQG